MKKFAAKALCVALTVLMLVPLVVSCSQVTSDTSETTAAAAGDLQSAVEEESTEPRDTRFDGVDFGGRSFRVSSSIDAADATNANSLIAGSGELDGELLNDAVFNRNAKVEELLNIELEFIESNYTYSTATSGVNTIVMSGDDAYEVIINDLRSLAALSVKGLFYNMYDAANFDYSKTYWYKNSMDDLQLIDGMEFVLMSDFFMDIIQSCHALYYNKDMCGDMFGDPNLIYNYVLDGTWTYDVMTELVNNVCVDLNGDSKINSKDQFGLALYSVWGTSIPFTGSSNVTFIDRSSGDIEFAMDNERSYDFLDKLYNLFYADGTILALTGEGQILSLFADQHCFIAGYQRLGNLAKMREIDFDIGVIPYPKQYDTDTYVTALHDTIECGVIPVTVSDTNFATTCLEVLNRETSTMLMYEYYETALKVKYTTDTMSASMIDIIHDNIGNAFPMAYEESLGEIMLHAFSTPLENKSTDFASTYSKKLKGASKLLTKMTSSLIENCG